MDELLEILTDHGWAVVDLDNVAYVGIVISCQKDGERTLPLQITIDGDTFRNAMHRIRERSGTTSSEN